MLLFSLQFTSVDIVWCYAAERCKHRPVGHQLLQVQCVSR